MSTSKLGVLNVTLQLPRVSLDTCPSAHPDLDTQYRHGPGWFSIFAKLVPASAGSIYTNFGRCRPISRVRLRKKDVNQLYVLLSFPLHMKSHATADDD